MINLWHWRATAHDQSLALKIAYDLSVVLNNLWHLRSIAYDRSLVLKIVAYDFCFMKIFFAYLS